MEAAGARGAPSASSPAPSRIVRAGRVVKRRRPAPTNEAEPESRTKQKRREDRAERDAEREENAHSQPSDGGSSAAPADAAADEEEEMFNAADLSDTVSALRLLGTRLHGNGPFAGCPIILRHQLYTILEDATAADMELERLRRENHLRMIKLHPGDVGLLLTATYTTRITAAIQKACSEERREALVLLRSVVGHVTNLSVSMEEMKRHFQPRMRNEKAAAAKPPSSSGKFGGEEKVVVEEEVRLLMQELVRSGFLVPRREGGQEVYWFSAPEAGRIAASIPRGRQAILAAINRSRYKEALDRNLQALKLRPKSELSVAFHLADMVGSGEITPVPTAAGTFYRIKT